MSDKDLYNEYLEWLDLCEQRDDLMFLLTLCPDANTHKNLHAINQRIENIKNGK